MQTVVACALPFTDDDHGDRPSYESNRMGWG